MLSTRFGNYNSVRSESALTDGQIMRVAPSIFADKPHESRSERYTYIPTIDILNGLRNEGFEPFFACQSRTRVADKREHTKHMLRLRHASQVNGAGGEASEIILVNSHDGSSSYQMLAGFFRFVCTNGLVVGDTVGEVRVRHQGDVVGHVIEGAYEVLESFEKANEQKDEMKAITLSDSEQKAFAHAALELRYGSEEPAPITETQLLSPRRFDDRKPDLWTTFNRVQENMIKGGLRGLTKNRRLTTTRAVNSIDRNIALNRALWVLSEEMKRIKA